jgi:hypothetical protein
MFRVTADSLAAYLDFDPTRKPDLEMLDAVMRKAASTLKRHFHQGTPAGDAGMRMKMIGYGKFGYAIKSGKTTSWPVVGVALQKNYISVYLSITKDGAPIAQSYAGRLGELRMGRNNFSFEKFDDLNTEALSSLLAEAADIFKSDGDNPVRYMQSTYGRCHSKERLALPTEVSAAQRAWARLARSWRSHLAHVRKPGHLETEVTARQPKRRF